MIPNDLRKASTVRYKGGGFPYTDDLVTFLDVQGGRITQAKTLDEKRRMVDNCKRRARGAVTLLAAWPGKFSQDVFVIDDLDAADKALNPDVVVRLPRKDAEILRSAIPGLGGGMPGTPLANLKSALDDTLGPKAPTITSPPGMVTVTEGMRWTFDDFRDRILRDRPWTP